MSNTKKVLLSPGDEIEIDLNGGDRPTTFLRTSSAIVLGNVPCAKDRKSVIYILQLCGDGIYHFAGIIDIEPLETKLDVKGTKNPFQLKTAMGFRQTGLPSDEKDEQYRALIFEETNMQGAFVMNPNDIKSVFAAE